MSIPEAIDGCVWVRMGRKVFPSPYHNVMDRECSHMNPLMVMKSNICVHFSWNFSLSVSNLCLSLSHGSCGSIMVTLTRIVQSGYLLKYHKEHLP